MNQDGKVYLVTWSSQKGSKLFFGTWEKRWDMNSICSCDQTWKYWPWGQLCCLGVAIRTHPESKSEAQKSFQANPNHRSPCCQWVAACLYTAEQQTSNCLCIRHESRLSGKQKLSDVTFCFSWMLLCRTHVLKITSLTSPSAFNGDESSDPDHFEIEFCHQGITKKHF